MQQERFAKMIESDPPDTPRNISRINLFATSTILALIISVPAIVITLIMYYVIKTNLILTVVAGSVALFIAMGFSIKISKSLVRY
jgi:ABC-type bacteriocin/lantibiotic exporter with double-glycine peptidase domain